MGALADGAVDAAGGAAALAVAVVTKDAAAAPAADVGPDRPAVGTAPAPAAADPDSSSN